MNDLAVADLLVENDLFKSFKQLNDIIPIAAFAHVEENLQTEFHLEKSNLLEFVTKVFQSQDGGSSSAEILMQAKQVVLQSQDGGSSSAETLTQKEQVVVQSLDGESVSASGEVPMSVAVAEGHDDAMLNDLIHANDEGVNQLSRNELEPSQVVGPVFAVVTRRQAASDRMSTNAGTTDDARDVRIEEGWTNDKSSRKRALVEGQKVLIMLPSNSNKLIASWEGPFTVLRRVNETNYEIDLVTRVTTLHINILREWHERSDQVRAVILVLTEDAESNEDEGELPLWEELHRVIGDCQIGDQLADM